MNFLRKKGIFIKINGISRKVYFQCVAIVGDNLEINEIMGFTQSFKGTSFCRMCKAAGSERECMIRENIQLLWNRANYVEDLLINDGKLTGIKEVSPFNMVEGYDVTENQCLDAMHDVLEGVAKYVMRSTIHNFICEKNTFHLKTLTQDCRHSTTGLLNQISHPLLISIQLKTKWS